VKGFGEVGNRAVIEAPFALFDEQMEVLLGDAEWKKTNAAKAVALCKAAFQQLIRAKIQPLYGLQNPWPLFFHKARAFTTISLHAKMVSRKSKMH